MANILLAAGCMLLALGRPRAAAMCLPIALPFSGQTLQLREVPFDLDEGGVRQDYLAGLLPVGDVHRRWVTSIAGG